MNSTEVNEHTVPNFFNYDGMRLMGCVKHKIQLQLNDEDQLFLDMAALVHYIGAKKHGLYNWQNDPEHTDSTVLNNVSALLRHYTALRDGYFLDDSGLPHLFHMACRVCMLETTYIREYAKTEQVRHPLDLPYRLVPGKGDDASVSSANITPEVLLTLSLGNNRKLITVGSYAERAVSNNASYHHHFLTFLSYILREYPKHKPVPSLYISKLEEFNPIDEFFLQTKNFILCTWLTVTNNLRTTTLQVNKAKPDILEVLNDIEKRSVFLKNCSRT